MREHEGFLEICHLWKIRQIRRRKKNNTRLKLLGAGLGFSPWAKAQFGRDGRLKLGLGEALASCVRTKEATRGGKRRRGWDGTRTTPTSSTATADDGTGRERRRAGTSESLLDEEEAEAGATRSRGRSGGLVRLGLR